MPARPEREDQKRERLWKRLFDLHAPGIPMDPMLRTPNSHALLRLSEEIAEEAAKKEREACAKLCDDVAYYTKGDRNLGAVKCAEWIRSRPSPREPEATT